MICNYQLLCVGNLCSCEQKEVMTIPNNDYVIEFDFNGNRWKQPVTVSTGMLELNGEWFNEHDKVCFEIYQNNTLYEDPQGNNRFKINVQVCKP